MAAVAPEIMLSVAVALGGGAVAWGGQHACVRTFRILSAHTSPLTFPSLAPTPL